MGSYSTEMSEVIKRIEAVGKDISITREAKVEALESLSKKYGGLDYLDDAEYEYFAGGPAIGRPYFANRAEIEAFIDKSEARP